jgi:hypothetical protein
MKQGKDSEEKIVKILKEADAGIKIPDLYGLTFLRETLLPLNSSYKKRQRSVKTSNCKCP